MWVWDKSGQVSIHLQLHLQLQLQKNKNPKPRCRRTSNSVGSAKGVFQKFCGEVSEISEKREMWKSLRNLTISILSHLEAVLRSLIYVPPSYSGFAIKTRLMSSYDAGEASGENGDEKDGNFFMGVCIYIGRGAKRGGRPGCLDFSFDRKKRTLSEHIVYCAQ